MRGPFQVHPTSENTDFTRFFEGAGKQNEENVEKNIEKDVEGVECLQTWNGDNEKHIPQSLPQEIAWPHLLTVPPPNKGQDTVGEETDYDRFPSLRC